MRAGWRAGVAAGLIAVGVLAVPRAPWTELRAAVAAGLDQSATPVFSNADGASHWTLAAARPTFPAAPAGLTPTQNQILAVAAAEYAKDPRRYDATVMTYTGGEREPWCADFVSYVMREAGVPLVNPHSGGWRIPGVLTLKNYYAAAGRYESAGTYVPRPGDVAIFDGRQGLDPTSKQHTAIVVRVEGSVMTTIGGNERGRIRLNEIPYLAGSNNLVGFGRLAES